MRRDNVAFLVGGLFYGVLIGFGVYWVVDRRPAVDGPGAATTAEAPAPAGPRAPTQAAPQATAPMVEEIASLRQRIEDRPDDIAAVTRLANLYHDAGMWEQAVDLYGQALEILPTDPNLLTDRGVCLQELGRYDEALEHFDQAQQSDPQHWQSLFNTVVVAGFSLGQIERAEAALARLEQVRPTAPGLDRLRQGLDHARAMQEQQGGPS